MNKARPPKHAPAGGEPAPGYDDPLERARAHERAGAFDAAIAAYGELARLHPARREPLQGLRRLYAERGSWEAVLQVAELEVGLLAPDERARLLSQMARIWERELGDAEQARQLLERARQERQRAALRKPAEAGDVTPASLVQRAWIAAARGDSTTALAALHEALALDASDVEAIDMMLTVLEGAERYAEMADLLERRAALASEGSTRAVVLARLGAVRELHQRDPGSARSAYERALEADPTNRSARVALQRIYRRGEAWPALRALLERAAASGTQQERAAASSALGQLLEQQLNDPRGAEMAYETARRLAPEDPVAIEGLRRLRTPRPAIRGRGAVADTPTANADASAPPREAPPGAPVQSDGDAHAAPALPAARVAASLAPDDDALRESALRAAGSAGGALLQLDLLDDLIDSAPDLATRAALLARRADVLRDGLGWGDEADQSVRDALEADPHCAEARARADALQA